MKHILYAILIAGSTTIGLGQQPFILSIEQPEMDFITDACQVGNRFYFIQIRSSNFMPPYEFDSYSDLLVVTEEGNLIEKIRLDTGQAIYHRFLKTENNDLYLIGHLKSPDCKSRLVLTKFNTIENSIEHLSITDLCNQEIQKIKIISGLFNSIFLEVYDAKEGAPTKNLYLLENDYSLTLEKDKVDFTNSFSVDFSRKGYLISADRLKRFYDADFNFRKQKWFYEEVNSHNESSIPFGKNLILLGTVQPRSDKPNYGFQFMLLDSLLNIKKRTIILPDHSTKADLLSPWYGGTELKSENEIWTGGWFYRAVQIDSGFFFIAKLDSNLNIICQHFYGYDSRYRMYGLRPLDTGGAIIFGTRWRLGYITDEWLDVFALRVGENCETMITSTNESNDPAFPIISAYPNPGINDLTFSIQGFDPVSLRVELFDESGRVLFSTKDLTNSLQVPDLPPRQYFYRILENQKILGVGAWIKQ